ncbi:peptidoglycan-binding domain-containing protein [Streptomyces sp. NPDC002004]
MACALLCAAACTAGEPAAAPQPHPAPYITGSGTLADDWRTLDRLGDRREVRSDLPGLWQAVLWADGYLPQSAITCTYDAATRAATRVWQSNHGLSADGVVGPTTYGFAGRRLTATPGWTVYRGERYDLPLRRDRDGVYEVWDVGRFHPLRTDTVTLARCRR